MTINVCHTLKINAPNVRWNTYEYIHRTGFWVPEGYFIRVKDKYGEYAKEELKVEGDERWSILECEIKLINWFLSERITKNDLEIIKSSDFLSLCEEYKDKSSKYVDSILERNNPTHMLIRKRWALELWKDYQNNYRFGIKVFRISNGKSIIYSDGGVEIQMNGHWYNTKEVDGYYWKWLEDYNILY